FVQGQFDLFWVAVAVSVPYLIAGICLGAAALADEKDAKSEKHEKNEKSEKNTAVREKRQRRQAEAPTEPALAGAAP
ncbi:MAG TPA: hypothetical protein VGC04_08760, partial [Cellulomonas sp.]